MFFSIFFSRLMALKDFCKTLQTCAAQLEAELRININDYNNLVHDNIADESKAALEAAKNYHYSEIIGAVGDIVEKVKMIIFHQNKLEWLSDESNFTGDYLKRFSFVKGQIYNFPQQQAQQIAKLSRSEQNLSVSYRTKRERRRTASECSMTSLVAWENYLDQKEKSNSVVEPLIIEEEIKKSVPKRTLSNARARKKFVSSTFGGFLDYDTNGKGQDLESINEDNQQGEVTTYEKENMNQSSDFLTLKIDKTKNSSFKNDEVLNNILDKFFYKYSNDNNSNLNERLSKSCEHFTNISNTEVVMRSKSSDDVISSNRTSKSFNNEQIADNTDLVRPESSKPIIVDVIVSIEFTFFFSLIIFDSLQYKSNPNPT